LVKELMTVHPKSHFENPKVRVGNIWDSKVMPNYDICGQATVPNVTLLYFTFDALIFLYRDI
jgi:hypothetical protein